MLHIFLLISYWLAVSHMVILAAREAGEYSFYLVILPFLIKLIGKRGRISTDITI